MGNVFAKSNIKIIILISLLILSLFLYISGIGYTTMDDAMFHIHALRNGVIEQMNDWALHQGRIQYYFVTPLLVIPHLIDNIVYYNLFTTIGILLITFSSAYFLSYFLKNNFLFIVVSVAVLALFQNGWGHNLITSYSFYIWLLVSIFFVSIVFLDKYLKSTSKKDYSIYFILMFLSLANEVAVLYFVCFTLFVIYLNYDLLKNKKIKSFFIIYAPLFLFLFVYFLFKYLTIEYQTYGGTKVNFDFYAIFKTMWQYSIGGFPGYYYIFDTYKHIVAQYSNTIYTNKLEIFLQVVGIFGFVKVFAIWYVGYLANTTLKDFAQKTEAKILVFLSIVVVSFIFASNFLHALTPKYQSWVVDFKDVSYVGSSFSYIGFVLLFVIALVAILKIKNIRFSNILLIVYLAILSVLSIFTSYTNYYVKQDQLQSQLKWAMVKKIFNTEPLKEIAQLSEVSANDLLNKSHGIMHTSEVYWSSYINLNCEDTFHRQGLYIKNDPSEKIKHNIKYVENPSKDLKAYLMLSNYTNNKYSLFVSNKIKDANLVFKTYSNGVVNFIVNNNTIATVQTKDKFVYLKNLSLQENDILTIQSSVPIIEDTIVFADKTTKLDFSDLVVSFDSGFYNDEGTHRWSGPEQTSTISIQSQVNKVVSVEFGVLSLIPRNIKVYLNDELIDEISAQQVGFKYKIVLNKLKIKQNTNILKFENLNTTQSPINSSDTRKLGFAISDFKIVE